MLTIPPLVTGCEKLTPNGTPSSMTLLRAGDEKVCAADDVHQTLHDLIVPKADEFGSSDSTTVERQTAINGVTLAYSLTTLEGFDKVVSRASCNTTLKIGDQDGHSKSFDIDYVVSPSADTSGSLIVTAQLNQLKSFAMTLILASMQSAAAERQKEERAVQEQQAKARVLAVVNAKWLAGTWILPQTNPIACSDGRAFTFLADHTLGGGVISGQWTLEGDQLHIVGQGANGSINVSGTITAADPVSFELTASDGTPSQIRRCTATEVRPPLPDTIGPGAQPQS